LSLLCDSAEEAMSGATGTGPLRGFPCSGCGARLEFAPGTGSLTCPFCSGTTPVPEESTRGSGGARGLLLDFEEQLGRLGDTAQSLVKVVGTCGSCGAIVEPPVDVMSFACPWCSTNIVATEQACPLLRPNAVLPFQVSRERATELYREWVRSRWLAPSHLKRHATLDSCVAGVYFPAWIYSGEVTAHYTGERGDKVFDSQGKSFRLESSVARWSPRSGVVKVPFSGVLVHASDRLRFDLLSELEPWDIEELVPYADEYLAGMCAERFRNGLEEGFNTAKTLVQASVGRAIDADIGGDQQRTTTTRLEYSGVKFTYALLPVWVGAYRFEGRAFRFLINGRTGEVHGHQPFSWVKVLLLVLALLALVVLQFWLRSL
jgi:predicted RNA-binding Zn-ribbon protein involved in translation (DUF1610 family)